MTEPCCPCVKVGDTLGLPPKPPIGTEIKVRDSSGRYRIRRDRDGWYIVGHSHTHISWRAAFREWLSEPGTVATVVRLP